MPKEVCIVSRKEEKSEENANAGFDSDQASISAYGYRTRVLVISDSDSDSDLPPPASLLCPRSNTPVAPRPKLQQLPVDIIEISSDSEEEYTPVRPRTGKLPAKRSLSNTNLPAVRSCLISDSLSTILERSNLVDSSTFVKAATPAEVHIPTPSHDQEPNSSDSEHTSIFDEDGYHPGLIKFDIGSRRPRPIPSGSSTSVTTLPAPGLSQSSCGDDDPFNDPQAPGTAGPTSRTGNAKAGSSSSGTRSRVRKADDVSTAPETPQLRPKPKTQASVLASSSTPVSLSPKPTPRNRAKVLDAQARALFSELNENVFDNRLPKDCEIVWSKKLNTTAGRAHWKRLRDSGGNVSGHHAYIVLSTKVVDCEERINNTLSHEMCHLAAWIFDGETNKHHGPRFKHWGNRVMEVRTDITITTCHAYKITYKYEWKCSSEECGQTFGRHSKSIDPETQACGCGGRLIPLFTSTPRRTAFQDYLKNHMKVFKASNPGMQHGEVMKRLGEMFRAEKEAAVDDALDQVMAGMTRLKLGLSVE